MAAQCRLFFMALIINFTVGESGALGDGAQMYYSPSLSGKKLKVFREGIYQYRSGVNYIIVPGNGSIFFVPALYLGERIRIQIV